MVQIERERALKWGKMIMNWNKYERSDKLHRRVNKGIPNSVRGAVWKHVLEIEKIRENGVYEVCVSPSEAAVVLLVCYRLHKSC